MDNYIVDKENFMIQIREAEEIWP